MKFKNMFSPIQIGPMTVKIVCGSTDGNDFANSDGTWSDQSVAITMVNVQRTVWSDYDWKQL